MSESGSTPERVTPSPELRPDAGQIGASPVTSRDLPAGAVDLLTAEELRRHVERLQAIGASAPAIAEAQALLREAIRLARVFLHERGAFMAQDLGDEVGVYDAYEGRIRLTFGGPDALKLAHLAIDALAKADRADTLEEAYALQLVIARLSMGQGR